MTSENIRHELEKTPFIPLRLHLSSGKTMEVRYSGTAWLQRNALLIVHPLSKGAVAIGSYDVVDLRAIERVEQIPESSAA